MDTDRVPAEITPPVRAFLGEDAQLDPSHRNVLRTSPRTDYGNLGPSSSENFHDTSSLQPLRDNNDHLPEPIPQSALPELNTERKNNGESDWIVPKEEKVSSVLILNLNRANSFTLKQVGSRTHSRRTSTTYPRQCYHGEG
jgi:hypothetical protein